MALAYYLPNWFFMYDLILELSFAVILGLVAFLAFRIYKITSHKQTFWLGLGFSFIALSNLIESVLNILIIIKTDNLLSILNNISFSLLNDLSVYSHILLRIIGLTILVYMTFKLEKIQVLGLMLITSILILFFSKDFIYSYYLLSTIYLLVISGYFIKSYFRTKRASTFLIMLAFIFLTIDTTIFVLWRNHELSYVLGHFPELLAYLLILWNFLLVRKK
ncbi:MAG: hypothetical protein WC867_01725 [Candidatus Pacearchaeota archaeon]|jgi:hypothetical protein